MDMPAKPARVRPVGEGTDMPRPEKVLDKRMANALFKDIDVNRLGKLMLGFDGRVSLALSRKLVGGIWVGGNAYLTPTRLEFEPNGLNKMFHKNAEALRVVIDLRELQPVTRRFGVGTKIIDLKTQDMTMSLRCLNSARFADAIENARINLDT